MTAAHVAIKAGNTILARAANGRIYSGSVVNVLPGNDMALIKLRGFKGHAATSVSNACLAVGSTLFSLGKPHAQGDTARFGTVETMSFGRPVKYGKFGYPDAMVMRMNTQKGESADRCLTVAAGSQAWLSARFPMAMASRSTWPTRFLRQRLQAFCVPTSAVRQAGRPLPHTQAKTVRTVS